MAVSVGVKQQNWARWEGDTVTPSAEMIVKICRAHACSSDWLLGLDRGKTSAVAIGDGAVAVNGSGNNVSTSSREKSSAACKACPYRKAIAKLQKAGLNVPGL